MKKIDKTLSEAKFFIQGKNYRKFISKLSKSVRNPMTLR